VCFSYSTASGSAQEDPKDCWRWLKSVSHLRNHRDFGNLLYTKTTMSYLSRLLSCSVWWHLTPPSCSVQEALLRPAAEEEDGRGQDAPRRSACSSHCQDRGCQAAVSGRSSGAGPCPHTRSPGGRLGGRSCGSPEAVRPLPAADATAAKSGGLGARARGQGRDRRQAEFGGDAARICTARWGVSWLWVSMTLFSAQLLGSKLT